MKFPVETARKIVIALFVLAIIGVVYAGWTLIRTVATINEPDPTKFNPNQIVKILDGSGVKVRADKVLYVNLDSMTYIFEGSLAKVDQSVWTKSENRWESNSSGFLLLSKKAEKDVVGYWHYGTPDRIHPDQLAIWKKFTN